MPYPVIIVGFQIPDPILFGSMLKNKGSASAQESLRTSGIQRLLGFASHLAVVYNPYNSIYIYIP
jgi:hypothetical protein